MGETRFAPGLALSVISAIHNQNIYPKLYMGRESKHVSDLPLSGIRPIKAGCDGQLRSNLVAANCPALGAQTSIWRSRQSA